MQSDLSTLEVSLSRVETSTKKAFDSEVDGLRSMEVDGEINDTICAETEDGKEFESAIVDTVSDKVTAGSSEGVGGHGGG